jgi:hypothetical protein
MILGDPTLTNGHAESLGRVTLDELFRHAATRRPDATALVDTPSHASLSVGPPPRRMTYAEADRVVSAIAGRLRSMLPVDSIVGIQMPHSVEAILTILGVLRAGLIATPLPLLWRRAELVAALGRAGAKGLITSRRAARFDYADLAMHVAAEVFSIRYVCGFGVNLPDGIVPLDDLLAAKDHAPVPPLDRDGNAAAHLAVISFETGENGAVPVARRHLELLAGGLGVFLEGKLEPAASILSTMAPASFAGICLTLVPWLLAGGTLVLHRPFDAEIFVRQWRDENCRTLVLPAPVAFSLADAGALGLPGTILAAWRAPERLAASADWRLSEMPLIDVSLFGETGLLALRRGGDGKPSALPLGPVVAPSIGDGGVTVAELGVSAAHTVTLRGPMVPRHAFPPGVDRSDQPHFKIGPDGIVDTGYGCQTDVLNNTARVTSAPSGIANVGGYRLPLELMRDRIAAIDTAATLDSVPDGLLGQRLRGAAIDLPAMQVALEGMGQNPLLARAFAASEDAPSEVAAVA